MPVPAAKFEEAFGLSWNDALAAGSVYNALDAVSTARIYFSCDVHNHAGTTLHIRCAKKYENMGK